MLRLCSDSSRSYPGRPVWRAVPRKRISILHGNMRGDQTGVSRGHSRCGNKPGETDSKPGSLTRRRAEHEERKDNHELS